MHSRIDVRAIGEYRSHSHTGIPHSGKEQRDQYQRVTRATRAFLLPGGGSAVAASDGDTWRTAAVRSSRAIRPARVPKEYAGRNGPSRKDLKDIPHNAMRYPTTTTAADIESWIAMPRL